MRSMRTAILFGIAAVGLAGCETSGGPPTEITRFHADAPIARGTVAIVPRQGDPSDLEFRTYAAALAPALSQAGFTPVDPGAASDLVATLDVERSTFATPPRGPAFSFGIGGASFGRHTGVGGDTEIGVGPHPGTAIGTAIFVQLRRRADNSAVWEGRGRTSAPIGSPAAQPASAVARLAGALFAGFPGESGRTVVVK